MENIIRQSILDFGAPRKKGQYKPTTVKLYMTNIVNFHKMVQPDLPFDNMEWAKDFNFVKNVLDTVPNLQTKRNYLNATVTALQTLKMDAELISQYITLRAFLAAQYDSAGYLTPNQKKIMETISKQDILDFLQTAMTGPEQISLREYQMWLAMMIHTRYPFRNELGEMKLIRRKIYETLTEDHQKSSNWYVLEKGWNKASFILTKYKFCNV